MTSLRFKTNPFHNRILVDSIERKDGTSYKVRESRDRYFFPDEWMTFFDSLKEKQKLTFMFLISTGARISEIRSVKVGDVDFERQNIVFRWTKSRNKDGTRKIRTIPVSSKFLKILKKIVVRKELSKDDYFPILSTPAANKAMTKALIKAGIPDYQMFSVHNVRKTTEMFLLALDVPPPKVALHMGHTLAVALKYYVSPEIFGFQDRQAMRDIIGDIYQR